MKEFLLSICCPSVESCEVYWMVRQFCNHCFVGTALRHCNGCKAVAYCSDICQRADWRAMNNHSASCGLEPASPYARIAAEHGSLIQYVQIGPEVSVVALSRGVLDLKKHMSSALTLMQSTPWHTVLRQSWNLKRVDTLAVAAQQVELQLGTDLVPVDLAKLAPAWSTLANTLRKTLTRYFRERAAEETSPGNQFVTNLLHELLTGAATLLGGSGLLRTITITLMKTLFSLANSVLIEPLRQLALRTLHWGGSVCSQIMFRTFDVESALLDKPALQAEAAALALLGEATLQETRQRKELGQYSAEMGAYYVSRLQAFLAHFLRSVTPEVSRQIFMLLQRFEFVGQFSTDPFGQTLEALLKHVANFVGSFKANWQLLVVDLLSGVQLGPSKAILLRMQVNLRHAYAEVPGTTHSVGEFAQTLDDLASSNRTNTALQEHITKYRELLTKLPDETARIRESLRTSGRYTEIVSSAINSVLPSLLWRNKPEAFDTELLRHCDTPLLRELGFEQMAIEHMTAVLTADRNNDEVDLEAPSEEAVELVEVGLSIGMPTKKKTKKTRDTSPVRKKKKKVAEDAVAVYAYNRAGGATLRRGQAAGDPLTIELIVRHEGPGPVANMGPSPAPSPAPGFFSSLGVSGYTMLAGAVGGVVVGGLLALGYAYFGALEVSASANVTAESAKALAGKAAGLAEQSASVIPQAQLAIQQGAQSGAAFNALTDGRLPGYVAAVMNNGLLDETALIAQTDMADMVFTSVPSLQDAARELVQNPAFDPNYLLYPEALLTQDLVHPGSIEAVVGEMHAVWDVLSPEVRQSHPWFRWSPTALADLLAEPDNPVAFGPNMQWLASLVARRNIGREIGPQIGPAPAPSWMSAAIARHGKAVAQAGGKLGMKALRSGWTPMLSQAVRTTVGDADNQHAVDTCAELDRFYNNVTKLNATAAQLRDQAEMTAGKAAQHASNVNPLNWLTMDIGLDTLTTLSLLYGAYTLIQIAQTRQGRSEKTHWLKWLSLFALGVDLLCWVNPLSIVSSALLRLSLFFGVTPIAALPIGIVTFLTQSLITVVQWQESGGGFGFVTANLKERRTEALLRYYEVQEELTKLAGGNPLPVPTPSQGSAWPATQLAPDTIAVQKKGMENQGFNTASRNVAASSAYPDLGAGLYPDLGINIRAPPLQANTLQSANEFPKYAQQDWDNAVYL